MAKTAVRAELAQVASTLFLRDGFENVTMAQIAAAAGVSRSTLLRHFGSKEDVVLHAWDVSGARTVEALHARPPGEEAWTALRRAFDTSIQEYHRDPDQSLATSRLVANSYPLWARQLEKQHSWRPALAEALAGRDAPPRLPTLSDSILVAAALDCLVVAIEYWIRSDGELDLSSLLDDAFATILPATGRGPGR